MSHTSFLYRAFSSVVLFTFLSHVGIFAIQGSFAASTTYFVDATLGSDLADGLSSATPWQTISKVNLTTLAPGDTVSFKCGESWTGQLLVAQTGISGSPIIFSRYGSCDSTNKPRIENILANDVSYITLDGLQVDSPTNMPAIVFGGMSALDNIRIDNTSVSAPAGVCMDMQNIASVDISASDFTSCDTGFSGSLIGGSLLGSSFSGITATAISLQGNSPLLIQDNTFTNIADHAIQFAPQTTISQNAFSSICTSNLPSCAALSNVSAPIGSVFSSTISENIIKNIGSSIGMRSYGIEISGIDGVNISDNTIQNAEEAIHLVDAKNIHMTGNQLIFSRARGVSVVQDTVSAVSGNTFDTNTIVQKNPDYPTIEMQDTVADGSPVDYLMTANANNFYPLYKPNGSFVRSIKSGGSTIELSKNTLRNWDANITLFEYFAYKSYTNTGSYANANLLNNPDLNLDASNWSTDAASGSPATLSHQPGGSYSGGSLQVTPPGGSADRMWVTNDAILSLTAGQTYLISGYAKSTSENINIRGFFHKSGDMNTIYSDRIAQTYATASGGIFSFYLTTPLTVSDAVFSLETDNQNQPYELDSLSVRRMNSVTKNNQPLEVQVFSNTGKTSLTQSCPPGAPCAAYVDSINVNTSWPLSIPAHRTTLEFWNNSPNILRTPVCSMNLSAGSVSNGQTVDVSWTLTDSLLQNIAYTTTTGAINSSITDTGSITFEPPSDGITSITIASENDIGPTNCSVQVTTTNTAPVIFPTTLTGSEDTLEMTGVLLGYDDNPGDTVFFETMSSPLHGSLTLDPSGAVSYIPNPDFCGNDTFDFRASDQYSHYTDPVTATMQVECSNDTPLTINDTVASSGGTISFDPVMNDTDPDNIYVAQSLTITGNSLPAHGTILITGNTFDYTPDANFAGSDSFTYVISDQDGAVSNTGTITITVTTPNNAPTLSDSGFLMMEDGVLSSSIVGDDIDGNTLSYSASVLPIYGNLTLQSNGNFVYTPDANFSGNDTFQVIATDGSLSSSAGLITIDVTPVNDLPIALNDNYSLPQDTSFFVPVLSNDTDVDSKSLSVSGVSMPSHGVLTPSGTGFLYTPDTSYSGSDSFTYTVTDDLGASSLSAIVTLSITSTNTPPVAPDENLTLSEDSTFTHVLAASDPEASTLTYIIDTPPTSGILTISSTGNLQYAPVANFFGTDSFSYHVSDGILTSPIANITLNITPLNDAPIALSGTYVVLGNILAQSGNILTGTLHGTDIDGDTLTYILKNTTLHGSLTLSATGYIIYNSALGFSGVEHFDFAVSDGILESAITPVDINVSPNTYVPPVDTSSGTTNSGTTNSGTTSSGTTNSGTTNSGTIYTGTVSTGGIASNLPSASSVGPGGSSSLGPSPSLSTAIGNEEQKKGSAALVYVTPIMVSADPTGLVSQLLLTHRSLSPLLDISLSSAPAYDLGSELETLKNSLGDTYYDPAVKMRKIAREYIEFMRRTGGTGSDYQDTIERIHEIHFDDARLQKTQAYIVRLLEKYKQIQEESTQIDTNAKSSVLPIVSQGS